MKRIKKIGKMVQRHFRAESPIYFSVGHRPTLMKMMLRLRSASIVIRHCEGDSLKQSSIIRHCGHSEAIQKNSVVLSVFSVVLCETEKLHRVTQRAHRVTQRKNLANPENLMEITVQTKRIAGQARNDGACVSGLLRSARNDEYSPNHDFDKINKINRIKGGLSFGGVRGGFYQITKSTNNQINK